MIPTTNTQDVEIKIASKEQDFKVNKLAYPSNMNSNDIPHITVFEVMEYKRGSGEKTWMNFETKQKVGTIYLPLATNLSYMDNHEWEEFDSGVLGMIGEGFTDANKSVFDSVLGGAVQIGKNVIQKVGGGSADKAYKIGQSLGTSINPMRSNVYVAPKFREFSFEYTLVARNQTESEIIKKIERAFRYYSYPADAKNIGFFKAPHVFKISHWSAKNGNDYNVNNYFPKYLPAALVAVNFAYNSNGDNYLHQGTFAPIDVKVTMAFKELEYDTKQKLAQRYGESIWN